MIMITVMIIIIIIVIRAIVIIKIIEIELISDLEYRVRSGRCSNLVGH